MNQSRRCAQSGRLRKVVPLFFVFAARCRFGRFGPIQPLGILLLAVFSSPALLLAQSLPIGPRLAGRTGPAEVRGTLLDSTGKPIAGALIAADRLSNAEGQRIFERRFATSGSSGEFNLLGLDPGVYRLCPEFGGRLYAEPCRWSPQVPTVSLSAGQYWQGLQLVVQKAQRLHVRVDDDDKFLQNASARRDRSGVDVTVGVYSTLGFQKARREIVDSGGESHFLVVPLNLPVQVSIRGKGVEFQQDVGGRKVDLKDGKDDLERVEFRDSDGMKQIRVKAIAPKGK